MLRRIGGFLLEFFAVFIQEMAEEQWNFRRSLTQRRHVDRQHVQSVIEVLAQAARFHGLLNFDVRGGKHAHVDSDHVTPAEARVLMILQNVQQLGLEMRAHLGDFVEENGALGGQLEFAGFRAHRAGERALLVAE